MPSQKETQSATGSIPGDTSNCNVIKFKTAGSSTQCNLSDASWESYAFVNPPQATDSLQFDGIPSNSLSTPLTVENLALKQVEIDLMPAPTSFPKILLPYGNTEPSGGKSPHKPSDRTSAKSPRNSHYIAVLQQNGSGSGSPPLEESPHGGPEWQSLLMLLEAEKEKMRTLHSMSPMERFMTYDRAECPSVVELGKENKGY